MGGRGLRKGRGWRVREGGGGVGGPLNNYPASFCASVRESGVREVCHLIIVACTIFFFF